MNYTQGQQIAYWRSNLSKAWKGRTRYPHGVVRRMLIRHPLRQLRAWLEQSEQNHDGSPIQWPAV